MLTSAHMPYDVRIFEREAKSLAAAGYSVTIVAPHPRSERSDNICIRAVHVPQARKNRMTSAVKEVYEAAREIGADIYHFHDPELIPVGILLKFHGKCVIYDAHEDVPRDILQKDWIPSPLKRLVSLGAAVAERLASVSVDRVVAATPVIAAKFNARKAVTIQNFPRLEHAPSVESRPYQERQHKAAYVGAIDSHRGVRELFVAMSLLPKTLGAQLYLAGKFHPPELESELLGIPGSECVQVFGWLSRNDVGKLLGECRVGLVTYDASPAHVDAQPNKLFEYMSAGIPVIASHFPLWREIVEGTGCGLLVDPRDPKAIADAAEWIFRHPIEAEKMGRRGAAAAEAKFNWAAEEKKLLNLYSQLASRFAQ